MQKSKVSVIVPCWGVEKYLDRCVNSLVNQTLRDIEIILVDDVSPDRVPEMCDAWAKKDPRIKVIHKAKNEGLGMACNTGIDAASGEYIAFCDSDDWVDAEMYETMHNAALEHKADMVFTGLKRVDADGNSLGSLPHRPNLEIWKSKKDIEQFALDMIASAPSIREDRTIQMSAKVVLYSNKIIREHNCRFVSEREVPSEDLHFNLHILSHSNCICSLPNKFYNYLVNTTSISRKPNLDRFETSKKLYFYLKGECKSLQMKEEYITRIQRMLFGQARSCVKLCNEWNITNADRQLFIRRICDDTIWEEIFKHYPIGKMPLPHRVFAFALRLKLIHILSIILKH